MDCQDGSKAPQRHFSHDRENTGQAILRNRLKKDVGDFPYHLICKEILPSFGLHSD